MDRKAKAGHGWQEVARGSPQGAKRQERSQGRNLKGVEVGVWEGPSPRTVFALYWAHTSDQTDRSFEAMEASVQLSVSLAAEFS